MTTHWIERDGGRIAYSDRGSGPLVVCLPASGDLRCEYRFLEPQLNEAGFRVICMDLRGHGESSAGWLDVSPPAIGSDIVALIKESGSESAIVVGASTSAGAAVWAATQCPSAVHGLVLIAPVVRDFGPGWRQAISSALFRVLLQRPWGSHLWPRAWSGLFPTRRPPDHEAAYANRLRVNFSEPGRLEALRSMVMARSRQAVEARLGEIDTPALVVMGALDREFGDPAVEGRIVAARAGGDLLLVPGAGHHPHVEFADAVGSDIVRFASHAARRKARAHTS